MPINAILTDAVSGEALATVTAAGAAGKTLGGGVALVTANIGITFGTFKAATRTTAGTTAITEPDPGGSLIVTWIVVSGEKQSGSDVTVRFTDGTNNVDLVVINQVDAPPNLSISFPSRVQGWEDARIDMITSGAGDATVSVGYIKIPVSDPFASWDSLR